LLRFKGLDTIAQIFLNEQLIGSAENMFVEYEYDVSDIIKKEENILRIYFKSPTIFAKEMIEKFKHKLKTSQEMPGLPYIRKAQYSFGWDWGPSLPDIGIWKDVELFGYDNIKIDCYCIETSFNYNKNPMKITDVSDYSQVSVISARVKIEFQFDIKITAISAGNIFLNCKLIAPDQKSYEKRIKILGEKHALEYEIVDPMLWWTHDLGTPNLYEMEITLENEGEILEFITQKMGIRDIQLIRNPDKWGESFFFMFNGIPIFAKGANWIPIDSFIPRGKKNGLYEMNIKSAVAANMNMIRVWGGGIYEDDQFYQLCDQLGVLVWQDFQFACAIYPIHEEFVTNVTFEAIQNIKRLRNHPSIALWCGNNELEWLWRLNLKTSDINDENLILSFKKGYLKIFEDILPNLIKKYDPNHSYWPSSPSNGYAGEKLGIVDSNSPDIGDSHFWDVWHGNKPFTAYRKFDSRFMSEFGFESFPSMKTIREFCPKDQFDFNSNVMENHQKNKAGNRKILKYMKKRFTIPPKFEHRVILSQITQAEAIQYGVEHWRRNRNDFHCMGTLYWQLNDCWPVASWSSLDYYGRWKAIHYFAKRFYQNVFASIKEDKDSVEFWVTNDLRERQSFILEW
ncbi:MAG: glycoside hydrolase family 2 protein, partial [Candidatus Lokiarchaeota archaeon]|nr:glycoside hydrolase family 2 protein [Candidatus Lokiarchaeota archaeon]